MRNQNNFKTNFVNLKKRLVIIVIILFSQFINAQIDGIVGPTLVISSAKSGTYEISKNNGFEISNEYVMAHVNSAAADTGISLAPNFKYLDQAINYYLDRNYQRIIILEGEYTVNNPIEIDFVNKYNPSNPSTPNLPILPSTTEVGNVGRITIEGEGFGTRISSASGSTFNVFEVKSNYNTIKNLSIIAADNSSGYCIALNPSSTDASHNVFENLYLGDQVMGSTTPVAERGILVNSSNGKVEHNRFKNIIFNGFNTGLQFMGNDIIFANHFEDLTFDNIIVGVDFASGANTNNNVFENLTLQADGFSTRFVNNVTGKSNYFNTLSAADFPSSNDANPTFSIITISSNAIHTTIENGTEIGRFGNTNAAAATFKPNFIIDNGKYTQLINCFGGFNSLDVNYVIGNNQDPSNLTAISNTEILGKLIISGNDRFNAPTAAINRFLKHNSDGYAVWSALAATTSTLWDYNATKNIRLNNYVITGNNNTNQTDAYVNGLRVGPNGNVRIGTAAPIANDGKLQVDGNFVSKQLNTDGTAGDAQLTVKDGKVIIGKYSDDLFTNSGDYNLLVNGKARVREEVYVKGDDTSLTWPDYVFAKEYKLMPLQQVEQHIQEKGYLPNMPSATEVEKEGIAMADMITRQQEKIEELTLYIIAMKKELEQIKANQK